VHDQLQGRRALVTGAGRGIGTGIALEFARQGADIVVHYGRSAGGAEELAAQIRELGRRVELVQADLEQPKEVLALADTAWGAFGGLDVLVNNAALFSEQHVFDTTLETFDRLYAVNTRAPFLLCQSIGRRMIDAGGGVIINVASGGGLAPRPGFETGAAYAASKAGLVMMSKRLAIDLAPTVRVNVLVPGIVDSKPKRWGPEQQQKYGARNLFNRPQQIEDVVPGAVFLASDASHFMTGEVLNIDGGALIANQIEDEETRSRLPSS
jgi:NAD(P)-dependent dehydrogenase (short-subunit alcohol dehydrogenase family)